MSRDKTINLYFISKDKYNQLMHKNLTKNYKKVHANYKDKINLNAQLVINDTQLKGKKNCATKKIF